MYGISGKAEVDLPRLSRFFKPTLPPLLPLGGVSCCGGGDTPPPLLPVDPPVDPPVEPYPPPQ